MSHETSTIIPVKQLSFTKAELIEQSNRNLEKIKKLPKFEEYALDFLYAADSDLATRPKINQMKKAAQKISELISPLVACKSGCSYCCHISVTISSVEADAMAKASGRKAKKLSANVDDSMPQKWFRVPCPFLKKGKCSVYDERPISCRLMFNIADTPEQCDTAIPSSESYVSMLNLSQLQNAYVEAFHMHTWGDIRDFFPS